MNQKILEKRKNTRIQKKTEISLNKRATPPTRSERSERTNTYTLPREKSKKSTLWTQNYQKSRSWPWSELQATRTSCSRLPSTQTRPSGSFSCSNDVPPFGLRPHFGTWKPPKKMPLSPTFLMSKHLLKFFLRLAIFLGLDSGVSSKNTQFSASLNFKRWVQIARNSHFFELLFSFFFLFFLFFFFFSGSQIVTHNLFNWVTISSIFTFHFNLHVFPSFVFLYF